MNSMSRWEVASAHEREWVRYEADGTAIIAEPGLPVLAVPPSRQFPAVRPTFDALGKALSSLSNSPRHGGVTLRERFDQELAHYERLVAEALAMGAVEPAYGSYLIDRWRGDLYVIAPEEWHRLALVTSNGLLVTDPSGSMSWREVRQRLESVVVGFLGLSVGGNVLEGWLREARPRRIKLADPDWVELTNLNRGERMSLRHVTDSRAARHDPGDPYAPARIGKVAYAAYEAQLVDPYLTIDRYEDGIDVSNLDRFLDGGDGEPAVDILVEEMDDLSLKVAVRQAARARGIDVLMASDFGHTINLLWNPFRDDPRAALGFGAPDETLLAALAETRTGERAAIFRFIAALCGEDFATDEFAAWISGRGEQPTASLPQSGATAMAAGGIAGKELALRALGHPLPAGGRVTYDLRHRRAL